MTASIQEVTSRIKESTPLFQKARAEINKVIVGQNNMIDSLFVALLADGHILLEGLPGLAKTLAVNTVAKVTGCESKRIQFTPDLLPADLVGTSIYNPKEGTFSITKGPIFTNILVADEINRAPPKVQSALLEVMQERQVTISGQTFTTGSPYLVLATQNPIESEGTYPLPEAQTDRFMLKVRIFYPSREEEKEIIKRMATLGPKPIPSAILSPQDILDARKIVNDIYVDDKILEYILDIVFATRYPDQFGLSIQPYILYGASPRASLALKIASQAHAFLEGRGYVIPSDVKTLAPDVLRHRLRRTYEAEAEDVSADDLIETILQKILPP